MIAEWFKYLDAEYGLAFTVFYDSYDQQIFLTGLLNTAELSVLCILLSVVIGVLGAWFQGSRVAPLRWLVSLYVHFFRNTPPLAQLYFFYFGVGALMPYIPDGSGGVKLFLDGFGWAVVSLSLFAGAFNIEIFRAGIEAVPQTTIEAAESLGYSRLRAYVHIVLPLAFRISLPALNNNLVTLVKGTTIAYAVGVPELLTASAMIWGSSINIPEMMNLILISFILLVGILVYMMHRWERAIHIPGYNV